MRAKISSSTTAPLTSGFVEYTATALPTLRRVELSRTMLGSIFGKSPRELTAESVHVMMARRAAADRPPEAASAGDGSIAVRR